MDAMSDRFPDDDDLKRLKGGPRLEGQDREIVRKYLISAMTQLAETDEALFEDVLVALEAWINEREGGVQ
jgi:hypothetical protein